MNRILQRSGLVVATHCVASSILLAGAAVPERQDSLTSVPNSVMTKIGQVLPEQSNAGAAYISEVYTPNLVVSENCTAEVIFLWDGAGYRNSFGYFTYLEALTGEITILSSNVIVRNASFPWAGSMKTGHTYRLRNGDGTVRSFTPGEKVGFWIVADGWSQESRIRNWNTSNPEIPANTGTANKAFGRGAYTSISRINPEHDLGSPELARHLAMIQFDGLSGFLGGEDFIVCGFEDLNRTEWSDDDFNDLIFIVRSTPEDAIENTEIFKFTEGDPDGDGVEGTDDHYPDDATRATVTRYPTHGCYVVSMEDLYPNVGDADYNDAVVAYDFTIVTDANGFTRDILGNFHLVARGAGLTHRLGLHIPGMPTNATGTIRMERFSSDAAATHEVLTPRSVANFVQTDKKRIVDLFPSTKAALPPLTGRTFTNTEGSMDRAAASARVHIELASPVDSTMLGSVPYDLYFDIKRGEEYWDIHFPGFPGFAGRPNSLPEETGAESFMDAHGYPWMIEVPTSWSFPLEKVHISTAFPDFETWRSSGGTKKQDWYLNPTTLPNRVSNPLGSFVPVRTWTVKLPNP